MKRRLGNLSFITLLLCLLFRRIRVRPETDDVPTDSTTTTTALHGTTALQPAATATAAALRTGSVAATEPNAA